MTQPVQEPSSDRAISGVTAATRQLARRPGQRVGGAAIYQIEVFEPDKIVIVEDESFEWEVPEDLDGCTLLKVDAYLTTPSSSGTVQVQLTKLDQGFTPETDILSTKIGIPVGEVNLKEAATQPVIANPDDTYDWGDHIRVDIDNAGSSAYGLGLITYWAPAAISSIVVQGAKGDPGGVTNWTGQYGGSAWTTSTNYVTGQIVSHGGVIYIATANHTSGASTEPGVGVDWMTVWSTHQYSTGDAVSNGGSSYVATVDNPTTEPGVDPGWEDEWMLLAEAQKTSSVDVVIDGSNFPLDTGPKMTLRVPYTCTLTECLMLADQTGSVVLDIWKDTYGSYPPTNADSITGASPPTISAATKSVDTILSGWTTALAEDDILLFNVDSCSTITRLTVSLKFEKA